MGWKYTKIVAPDDEVLSVHVHPAGDWDALEDERIILYVHWHEETEDTSRTFCEVPDALEDRMRAVLGVDQTEMGADELIEALVMRLELEAM